MRRKICKLVLSAAILMMAVPAISFGVKAEQVEKEKNYLILTDSGTEMMEGSKAIESSDDVATMKLTKEEAVQIEQEPEVLAVEEDILLRGFTEEVDEIPAIAEENEVWNIDQWSLRAIHLVDDALANQASVKIEILDSGISYTDDIDVAERVNLIPGDDEVPVLYDDANGHGTALGGIIAAKDNGEGITGINPNAEIYSVKVLDQNLETPLSRVIEGIYWGIENDVDIINMSFGTPVESEILRKAVQDAADAGILLVAAAGNTPEGGVQYPAAFPEVIAVGSVEASGQIAEHTPLGEELELLAPGKQVMSTGLFYGVLETEGTSIATAQVTGVASLLMGRDGEKSPQFIRQLLKESAKPILINEERTVGLIDHGYAVEVYEQFEANYTEGGEERTLAGKNENCLEDYSEEAEIVISGLWGNGDKKDGHYSSTVWAANSVGGFSSRQIKLMYTAATKMDYIDEQFKTKSVEALHGRGNYVMNLSFLWELANELGKNDDKVAAINTVYNRVVNRCKPTGGDADKLSKLKDAIDPYILQWNMIGGGESNREARKFKVLGAAMHMVGDICAHRTMVPVNGLSFFSQSDILNSTKAAPSDSELKNWLRNGVEADAKAKLKAHANWALFKRAIATGCMEFRDVGKFTKDGARNYADDASFYNERFVITKNASTRLLKANSLADSRKIMIPRTHFIKFNNLKEYFKKAGGSESAINYWSSVSTDGFV